MQVLLVLPYLECHGTERHALLLARYLIEAGHGVMLASPQGPGLSWFQNQGVSHCELPLIGILSFRNAIRTLMSRTYEFDLVHVHAAQELCGGLRVHGYRGPLIFTAHCYDQFLDYAKAGLFLNPFCQGVIAVSEAERDKLARAGVKNLFKVLNGIDLVPFSGHSRSALRNQLGIPTDRVVAITVGRLVRIKAYDLLLGAMAQAENELHALIVGSGPEEPHLQAVAERLGIVERVRFLGHREDVPRLLAAADIYVAPSRREGLSLAALEACAAGLPLVVTDLPEFREVVSHGENGLVFPVDRLQALAQALAALAASPKLREEMGLRARERAASFSWTTMGEGTCRVYAAFASGH